MSLATARISGLPYQRQPASLEALGPDGSPHHDPYQPNTPPSPDVPPILHSRRTERNYTLGSWTPVKVDDLSENTTPVIHPDGTLHTTSHKAFVFNPDHTSGITNSTVPKETEHKLQPGTNVIVLPEASENTPVLRVHIYGAITAIAKETGLDAPNASQLIAERINKLSGREGSPSHVTVVNVAGSVESRLKRLVRSPIARAVGAAVLATSGVVGMKYNWDTAALAPTLAASVYATESVMRAGLRLVRGDSKWRPTRSPNHSVSSARPR